MFKIGNRVKWFCDEEQRVYEGVVDKVFNDGTLMVILDGGDIANVPTECCDIELN